MPFVRAINQSQLLLLRSLRAYSWKTSCQKNLLDHHKANHPKDIYLNPVFIQPNGSQTVLGYEFFGRFIEVSRVVNPQIEGYIGSLASAAPMLISDIAAIVLEQTFGRADPLSDVFSVDWGMPENGNPGGIFWDVENDRIIARTGEGFDLAIEGTNIVEAAVYLPRMYSLMREIACQVPEGIQFVQTKIEGEKEEWSMAASPLQVKINLPNLSNVDIFQVDQTVRAAFKRAISNRVG